MKKSLGILIFCMIMISVFAGCRALDNEVSNLQNEQGDFVVSSLSYEMDSETALHTLKAKNAKKSKTETKIVDGEEISYFSYTISQVELQGQPFSLELEFTDDKLVRCVYKFAGSQEDVGGIYDDFCELLNESFTLSEEEVLEQCETPGGKKYAYNKSRFSQSKEGAKIPSLLFISGYGNDTASGRGMETFEIILCKENLQF